MRAVRQFVTAVMLCWPLVTYATPGMCDAFHHEPGRHLDILCDGMPYHTGQLNAPVADDGPVDALAGAR
ncbi:MAG: hypothetical protein OES79_12240 [Planctomycetota bacterium]|nr:hypothetical protein [Planctomycetota bacterium]